MKSLKKITPIDVDFSQWFIDAVKQSNLIKYGTIKGTIIFKPLAFELWDNIKNYLDKIIKNQLKAKNVYIPALLDYQDIRKEMSHVQGFSPELLKVFYSNKNCENQNFAVLRPTSEVEFCKLFKEEIEMNNELPLIFNQWVNVWRLEKKTNPFLRTIEFLWQEGHSVHKTKKEAFSITKKAIKEYYKFLKNYLAIPTIMGQKTELEKFAGAKTTFTIEAMMKDGKALQCGTSHYLGQNFAKVFDISYQNNDNQKQLVFQTSWGISTRLIGAIIMVHGDNKGIILPPKIAPYQIDILDFFSSKYPNVLKTAKQIFKILKNKWRVRLFDSDKGVGYKMAQSEIQGTPIKIEIGPKDIEKNQVVLVRRDTLEKFFCPINEIVINIKNLLNQIHNDLYKSAKKRLEKNIIEVDNYLDFKKSIKDKKFVLVFFNEDSKLEKKIKDETMATIRCKPINYAPTSKIGKCFYTGIPTKTFVIFARNY